MSPASDPDAPLTSSSQQKAEDLPLPGGDFRLFITRLSYQGMLCLGVMENPVTKTRQVNLDQARMVLDDLIMLQERTSGNLDSDEAAHMHKIVGDLSHLYEQVQSNGQPKKPVD
ncbi:MAG: DUF1844 domain-containing protein [Planctomycetota bacterium]|jgi:hypothetical protein|nr:DUF1844 domain-containing protein [Planctomycetota bacterium]MDP6938966.1 DUF1844 domain-containing protein [Planctomycetota bacterium]